FSGQVEQLTIEEMGLLQQAFPTYEEFVEYVVQQACSGIVKKFEDVRGITQDSFQNVWNSLNLIIGIIHLFIGLKLIQNFFFTVHTMKNAFLNAQNPSNNPELLVSALKQINQISQDVLNPPENKDKSTAPKSQIKEEKAKDIKIKTPVEQPEPKQQEEDFGVVNCQYCQMKMQYTKLDTHEYFCESNPQRHKIQTGQSSLSSSISTHPSATAPSYSQLTQKSLSSSLQNHTSSSSETSLHSQPSSTPIHNPSSQIPTQGWQHIQGRGEISPSRDNQRTGIGQPKSQTHQPNEQYQVRRPSQNTGRK
ncbi:MAG: hypothetical protein EZS28_043144, partial [Streblomastix strix]